MNKKRIAALSALCGFINGLLGAGGGIPFVLLYGKMSGDVKKAHALSVAVMLPITAVSAAVYLLFGRVTLSAALPYLPMTVVGALLGSLLLKRASVPTLRRVFGALIIFGAVRTLWSTF